MLAVPIGDIKGRTAADLTDCDSVFAGLQEPQDSALQFSLKVWCASSDYWTVYYSLTERVNAAFIRNGIEIPFPQLDVHVKQEQKTEKEV